jgi:hypothetical protein
MNFGPPLLTRLPQYKLDTYRCRPPISVHLQHLIFLGFTRAKSCARYVSSRAELFAVRNVDESSPLEVFLTDFQIGKELLLPELPMTIRLIGLRVTNLKDLRIKEDRGIKRVSCMSLSYI